MSGLPRLSGTLMGLPVFLDENAKHYVVRVKGVADARRPNTRRPYFHKVLTVVYDFYLIRGRGYIMHPQIKRGITENIEKSTASIQNLASSLGLAKDAFMKIALATADFSEVWRTLNPGEGYTKPDGS